MESPSRQPIPAYADVYVAENRGEMSPRFHSEARTIPQAANKKSVFRESYENMHWNEELMSKYVYMKINILVIKWGRLSHTGWRNRSRNLLEVSHQNHCLR